MNNKPRRYKTDVLCDPMNGYANHTEFYICSDIDRFLPTWVSTEDRLPLRSGKYETADRTNKVYFDGQMDWYYGGELIHVTYWLDFEMPEAPHV